MKTCIIILILSYCTAYSFAQFYNVDSLHKLISRDTKEDTIRSKRLLQLSISYAYNKPDSGIYYANEAWRLSQKQGYTDGERDAYRYLAQAYWVLGDYAQSMQYALKDLNLSRQLKKAATEVSGVEIFIGDIYMEMGDYQRALHYYFDARKTLEASRDTLRLMFADESFADAYMAMNRLDSALFFAKEGFALDHALGRDWTNAALVLGNVYVKRNQFDSALYYYRLPFKTTAQNDLIDINNGMAAIYRKKGQPDSCRYYAKMAFDTAQLIRYQRGAMQASELLSWVYEKTAPAEAIRYYKISSAIKDSLYNRVKISRVNFLVFDQKLKDQELQAARIKYQNRLKMYGLLGAVGFFLLTALFLWRNNRHRQKAYALLQKQKQETDHQRATAESALEELKATQTQLIQSEKMASLGELTAGIAHEIQNPLNFVNNFSEVNNELVDELKQEAQSGRINEVLQIADEIKNNGEKINQHGRRADAIVKNMLQHSRRSTGEKQLTDINALADEYLRLSYHGFRAKDKSFNAGINTDFDTSIGKINVIPQDIGRVLINLFNNAFYAVQQKRKQSNDNYKPIVSVSTQKLNDTIEIHVIDNGNGIPQKIVNKIFQPFFTTKPTGEGTGLGLSLSYDIIKAHGGELKVDTQEGVKSEFVILLPA